MQTLHQASQQWASRPADQRFTSLTDLHAHFDALRKNSRQAVIANRDVRLVADRDDPIKGLAVEMKGADAPVTATHWSFGQLCQLAKVPGDYARRIPAALAADNLNYGLRVARDVEEIGVLSTQRLIADSSAVELRAATGPNYGRIWCSEVTGALVNRFGDGRTGDFKVPGEFGHDVAITKENTTLYGSDRDMFVFLADEKNRIELPDRRAGRFGTFARGFFVWNSEVGYTSIGAAFFLFDYTCCNRIVWDVQGFKEVRLRHTSGAPARWLEQVSPVLIEYSHAATQPVVAMIEAAKSKKIEDVNKFLLERQFSQSMAKEIEQAHVRDEGRPIENVWDAVTGVTALARTIPHQDQRVALERRGGALMKLAA
jgi:hypothetical protein